jgi:hypothetical protein
VNKQLRDEWVKALRSGEYKQIQGLLTDINESGERGYCCLGVLCRVAGLPIARITKLRDLDEKPAVRKVRDLADLGTDRVGSIQDQLATMNDDHDVRFPEIADWIEQNIPVTK